MSNRKNMIKKARAQNHSRNDKQRAQGDRYWACGRKKFFATQEEAQQVADAMGHLVYPCVYCKGFHTAHLPGSKRFVRGVAA